MLDPHTDGGWFSDVSGLVLALDQVPAIAPHVRVESLTEGIAFVIGERARYVLAGDSSIAVARLVDGRRTVEEIVRAAAGQMSEPEVWYVLEQLASHGFLVRAAPEVAPEQAAFWHGLGADARTASRAVADAVVAVRAVGAGSHAAPTAPAIAPIATAIAAPVATTMTTAMTDALSHAGVRVADTADEPGAPAAHDGSGPRLTVVVTADILAAELAAIARQLRAAGAPWLLVQPIGLRPLVGPLFAAKSGPCWSCLAHFARGNRPVEELIRRHRDAPAPISPPPAWLPATVRAACSLAALQVVRALARPDREGDARVLALDPDTLAAEPHAVIARPQCPACGDPGLMAARGNRPIALAPVARPHDDDGGYRRHAARHTYERLRHLVSPITGPVTHLVPMPGRDTPLRAVYASGYLTCPRDHIPRDNAFDKPCAGKGRDPEQARVSALCEALERQSGIYQGDEARVRCRIAQLGSAARSPDALQGFSDAQYDEREARNRATRDRRQWVPERFDPDAVIDWTPGWSLTRNERCYVPLSYCFYEPPADSGVAYCPPCGNGVAAGTCLEEAILQGVLELVERDAVAIWWYNMIPRPALDLASFGDRYFDALRADYERLGWRLWALDLTHDIGIAACAALAHEPRADRFAVGFGCHLDGRLAVQRALTELNQIFHPTGSDRAPWNLDRLPARAFLAPDDDARAVTADRLPRTRAGDLRADIEQCVARLADVGVELLVVDKTRPDIDLAVAQVIAPGLRHIWPRLGPGRLYRTPCRLGWIPAPLDERALNPVPLLL